MNELPNAASLFIHDDSESLSAAVAQRIAVLADQAIAARGVFRLALAGGETPRPCYEKLRQLVIDWQHVHIYFGDERCLPVGDAARNDTMANEVLIKHVEIPAGNVHAIPAELGAVEAAAGYAAVLQQAGRLDMVLLGMGEDGHTASLFPGNVAIENLASVVPVFGAPKPPAARVSLGLGTLNSARLKLFLVSGVGKREAMARIVAGATLPAVRITSAEWHIDRAALPK